MTKKLKIKYEIARASRSTILGAARNTAMIKVQRRYNLSSDGAAGTRALGRAYSGGDYWVA